MQSKHKDFVLVILLCRVYYRIILLHFWAAARLTMIFMPLYSWYSVSNIQTEYFLSKWIYPYYLCSCSKVWLPVMQIEELWCNTNLQRMEFPIGILDKLASVELLEAWKLWTFSGYWIPIHGYFQTNQCKEEHTGQEEISVMTILAHFSKVSRTFSGSRSSMIFFWFLPPFLLA